MQRFILFLTAIVLYTIATQTIAAPATFTISTFKNGQQIVMRKVSAMELRTAILAMTSMSQDKLISYDILVRVAMTETAKDRCFNLFSSRMAVASISAGMLDASPNAELLLKNSISSIEDVNSQTQVTCTMQ